ncbi:MAG TPA: flagellar biosynthetic protein FliO [Solirubrobacteraceae bacterium]|nr:flagellar biosynthetic protein FliO [Solirubrobacteraceae bacterium]
MKSLTLTRGAALAGALTLVHASAASAAGGENTPLHLSGSTGVHVASSGSSSSIVRTVVGLFIVIAVIYGVSWILRQARRGKDGRASGQGLSHLASLPLGSGRSVALVRAGQEIVLIGIAEHGITPIRTYTEAEAIELGLWDQLGVSPGETLDGTAERAFHIVDRLRRMTVRS